MFIDIRTEGQDTTEA